MQVALDSHQPQPMALRQSLQSWFTEHGVPEATHSAAEGNFKFS
jgi:hypothetical protein